MDSAGLAHAAGADWIGAVPHEELRRSRPVLPRHDPFYEPPTGFEHAAPGTVLRTRDVELGFLGFVPQKFFATQLLYRSSDRNGAPEAAVTTVLVPAERGPENVCPIVSYQCAIDAVTDRCFPSYAMRRRAFAPGALAQFEFLLVAAALAEGWAVSVPDHEGTHGMWGAPYEPGYRILDGLRAATSCERLGISRRLPDRALGLLRRRPCDRVGGRDVRGLRTRAQHRRCRARVAGRRSRARVQAAQRLVLRRAADDGDRRAVPHLPGASDGHRTARHRRGTSSAQVRGEDDDGRTR